ncbi:glycerophosphodiester phosphodiesterase family protein [Marinicella sp. W31]|uniref:glycerophosphodiester phosphodiesterase family protein n=1 Tax=Marinicella sp. W31 TaxID=3023713 RepID=UPI003757897E
MHKFLLSLLLVIQIAGADNTSTNVPSVKKYDLGPRPLYLVESMRTGELQDKLLSCRDQKNSKTAFSMAHRGAPLQFPEHTRESYMAAARMGAGVIECDVAFTKDKQLVCRHAQCDLHTTTNILAIPELAAQCSEPFKPANPATNTRASARCCTSDITLAQFKKLCGKMDAANLRAQTIREYMQATASWRTDLYAQCGTLMTHQESIELFKSLQVKFVPELKTPEVEMPFTAGYDQEDLAAQMIQEYQQAGVPAELVYPQSFLLSDVLYWIKEFPEFGKNAIYLDNRMYKDSGFKLTADGMRALKKQGVQTLAPPLWALLEVDRQGQFQASKYAQLARAAELQLVTWSLERSVPIGVKNDWYYQGLNTALKKEGDIYYLLDALVEKVGVKAVFSDWPATTTYYANCMAL